jgi:hypothetical protein
MLKKLAYTRTLGHSDTQSSLSSNTVSAKTQRTGLIVDDKTAGEFVIFAARTVATNIADVVKHGDDFHTYSKGIFLDLPILENYVIHDSKQVIQRISNLPDDLRLTTGGEGEAPFLILPTYEKVREKYTTPNAKYTDRLKEELKKGSTLFQSERQAQDRRNLTLYPLIQDIFAGRTPEKRRFDNESILGAGFWQLDSFLDTFSSPEKASKGNKFEDFNITNLLRAALTFSRTGFRLPSHN